MKVLSFEHQGVASYGLIQDGEILDAGARLRDRYPTLRAVLEAGALAELAETGNQGAPRLGEDDIAYSPLIPDARKIILVGLNYDDHRIETGRKESAYPVLFSRSADAQVGHKQPMVRPGVSERYDYEGELAVIIGKAGREIAEADAYDHVAGYTCFNDGSIRDWQRHTHQFLPGKNFASSGAFGPYMVTPDEVPDVTRLTVVTRLNGEEMQRGSTADFIFTIPVLINYISTFTPLAPADVIVTGTPGGVGFTREPPVFMEPGDTIEIEISDVGTLTNPIVDA